MRKHLPSETALKVAHSVLTLSHTPGWSDRLPRGTADLTEQLMLAAELSRFTPRMIASARTRLMVAAYRANDWLLPGLFEALGHRKCQMNAWALDAIADGFTQVAVLGAGFDTLAMRLAPEYPDTAFFEIDHPATARAKHKAIHALTKPDNVHLLGVDLAHTPLHQAMANCSAWEPEQRSLFIAEGLLMYLSNAHVHELFTRIAKCTGPGSRAGFSHALPSWTRSVRGHVGRGLVAALGEPILSWVTSEDLPDYLSGTGWQIISGVDSDERHSIERYALAQLGSEAEQHNAEH